MTKDEAIKEVEEFYNTYCTPWEIIDYEVCETKLEKDIIVHKLIYPYFHIKSQFTTEEWMEKIVNPLSETIFCMEEAEITPEEYYKSLEEAEKAEEEAKIARAKKMQERREARRAEKKKFRNWLTEIKKNFSENTDYMAEGFERGMADKTVYNKFQFKIIGSITSSSYCREERLFWEGFRKGLKSRKDKSPDSLIPEKPGSVASG